MAGNIHQMPPPHVAAVPANDYEVDEPTDREQGVYIDRPLPRTLAYSLEGDVHQQKQSALFGCLPAEVRDKIFEYVFSAYTSSRCGGGPGAGRMCWSGGRGSEGREVDGGEETHRHFSLDIGIKIILTVSARVKKGAILDRKANE